MTSAGKTVVDDGTGSIEARPREARVFAEKAARSIIEVQESIESIADIAILLEILGITKEDIERNGFNDLYDLAVYIYNFIDFYEVREKYKSEFTDAFLSEVPSKKTRLVESLAMTFPWSASLALLFVSGISLWMMWGLPADNMTAFMIGVFLGIFITEGPLAVFQRFFMTNHDQLNEREAMRTVKRNFVLISLILVACASLLLLFGYLANSPTDLVLLSVTALVTVSLHRASYMIVYMLKKLRLLVLSYSIALALLLLVFSLASGIMPDIGSRYLVALGVAFAWLSISAFYAHYKIFSSPSTRGSYPSFYRSSIALKNPIKSRVMIQLRDALPYYVFGTFFFAMVFGDRMISWFFNPALHLSEASLPLLFNSIYHSGADPAMLVLAITSVVQYVIMAAFYREVSNITVKHGITEMGRVNEFFKERYKKLMLASIVISCCVAVSLNLLGPELMTRLGASDVSLKILTIASLGNVFLSIFVANSMFATFLNRVKALAIIALFATLILALGGFVLAPGGFENIAYAFLASTAVSAVLSSLYMMRIINSASSIFFAKF